MRAYSNARWNSQEIFHFLLFNYYENLKLAKVITMTQLSYPSNNPFQKIKQRDL